MEQLSVMLFFDTFQRFHCFTIEMISLIIYPRVCEQKLNQAQFREKVYKIGFIQDFCRILQKNFCLKKRTRHPRQWGSRWPRIKIGNVLHSNFQTYFWSQFIWGEGEFTYQLSEIFLKSIFQVRGFMYQLSEILLKSIFGRGNFT